MNCTCRGKSAFRWSECDCASIFGVDDSYTRAASKGVTMSQIATTSVTRFESAHGRSLGTVGGLSSKSDKLTAERNDTRRLVRQAKKKGAARG